MNNISNTSIEVELKNCAEDFVYFCENYVKIVHPKLGLIPFKLHDFQKRYIEHITNHRFVIGKKFRQGGFSTLNAAWLTWRLLFKLDENNMVCCKTDREAVYSNRIVRKILDHIPEWLVPTYGKFNDHNIENADTGSKISFYTFEASCGRAVTHLIIEEAAFIGNMDQHWKAMFPTLSTGGHCIAMSSVNGACGWFYETYKDAQIGTNGFSIFECNYTEHPDYNDPKWAEEMKGCLGERGWCQEILCEFLEPIKESECNWLPEQIFSFPKSLKEEFAWEEFGQEKKTETPPVAKPSLEKDLEAEATKLEAKISKNGFYCGLSLEEERKILHECRKRAYEQGKGRGQLGNIKDNKDPVKLTHDNVSQPSQLGNNVSFDYFDRPQHFRNYYWSDIAEEIVGEYAALSDDPSLENCIKTKKQNLENIEFRVNEGVTDDLLILAGVISEEEVSENKVSDIEGTNTDQEVLARIKEIGRFPESLRVSFSDKRLCVNGVPTNICEFDLCCLYNGLLAFTTHEKAINKIAKLICKKMNPLFGIREEK